MMVALHCNIDVLLDWKSPGERQLVRTKREHTMRIFIADDSPLMLERLAWMVSELPGAVRLIGQASDAREASEAIRRLRPDVVILDIRMSGGSGIDVLRQIKRERPAPVVLMLTNCSYRPYRDRCMAIGADFFLDKSTEFEKVPKVLQRLIQTRYVPPTRPSARKHHFSGSRSLTSRSPSTAATPPGRA
jgi:DNA-binding NarL/FixJ family response regulator